MGVVVKIIEKTLDRITCKEGKELIKLSIAEGEKKLVTNTILNTVGTKCGLERGLFNKEFLICSHSGSCTCSTFFVQKVLCRHLMLLSKKIFFLQQGVKKSVDSCSTNTRTSAMAIKNFLKNWTDGSIFPNVVRNTDHIEYKGTDVESIEYKHKITLILNYVKI